MVAPRVKFRCVHCNRLLSASTSRIGKAIACPKCVQAVIVPVIGAGGEADSGIPEKPRAEPPESVSDIATAIPDEILAIQPEDIRAEIPFLGINIAPADRRELLVEAAQSEDSVALEDAVAVPATESILADEIRTDSWFTGADALSNEKRIDEVKASPPIEIETTPLSISSAPTTRHASEVTLPASAVLAWSLFVLFAQALAFLAGLLIGHYYWKHV